VVVAVEATTATKELAVAVETTSVEAATAAVGWAKADVGVGRMSPIESRDR